MRYAGYGGELVGIEWDAAACATAEAAGHLRLLADVASCPLDGIGYGCRLIASPPCPSFSAAGARSGAHDLPLVRDRIRAFAEGDPPSVVEWADKRSVLTAEPMRWARALRPRWIALEQVPSVLPVWQQIGEALRSDGYSAWCGVVNAADFGVPQVRKRAVLLASLDRPVAAPVATHAEHPADALQPWVTMAAALGWGMTARPYFTLASSRTTGGPDKEKVGGSAARKALYAEREAGRWIDPPAAARFADGSIRVTMEEAAQLQSFRHDYPWHGTATARFQQLTNAVPPLLAMNILRGVL